MKLLLLAMGLMGVSGLAALAAGRSRLWASRLGAWGAAAGCALGLIPSLRAVFGAPIESLRWAWSLPGGTFFIELDALSGFFLVPTLLVSGLAAIYGTEYLLASRKRESLGPAWFCYNLLVLSMTLVLVARNGLLFLLAWEAMALASFFLVAFEHEEPQVREAGWTYLVATHLGSSFILVLFVLLGTLSGTLDFDAWSRNLPPGGILAGTLFLLAVVGFGTKAGFLPLHVWLPEAHPAAPSHVSAVMSGVMIKTGIYGLARMLMFLGPPPAWWGWLLVGIGIVSGVLGVLYALAQHDLKRLLAYHSVENIGIIALGLGLGLLGLHSGSTSLAVLGFAGALLHVLNHALFKSLLFLGAGSVLHGAGTREIDRLGGLLKRMPWTGATFLVGAASISGLPPLNGFVSEFLLYLGAFRDAAAPGPLATAVPALLALSSLALIGGLAAACFTKAFGVVFLGEPRSAQAAGAHEAGLSMRLPMAVLAAACALIGLFPDRALQAMAPALRAVIALPAPAVDACLAEAAGILSWISLGACLLLALVLALAVLRHVLLAGRSVEETVTWDCGYARPTARMQYTASSFAQPLNDFFGIILRTRVHVTPSEGLFPRAASLATKTADACRELLFDPLFTGISRMLGGLRGMQHGRIQLYVLYIVLTLLVLLVWKMGIVL